MRRPEKFQFSGQKELEKLSKGGQITDADKTGKTLGQVGLRGKMNLEE